MGLAEKKYIKDAVEKLNTAQGEIRKLLNMPELIVELDTVALEKWLQTLPKDAEHYKNYVNEVAFSFEARKSNNSGNYADYCLFVDYALLCFMKVDAMYEDAVRENIKKIVISARPYMDFYSDEWNVEIAKGEKKLEPPLLTLEQGTLTLHTFNYSTKGYLGEKDVYFWGSFPNFHYLKEITPEHAQKYFAPFKRQLEALLS